MSVVPLQKPGKSVQVVETPADFLDAVRDRFGHLDADLACTRANRKALIAFAIEDGDSLARPWSGFSRAWCNPPFANIAPWVAKAARTCPFGHPSRILMLTPASVGSEWFDEHVHGKAYVLGLRPRLTFVGHSDPYPKDMILSVYGMPPGFDTWRWK